MRAPRDPWDVCVVGAGIVGLAVARELALGRGKSVLVLEAEADIGSHQTGRNSGVVHSGLYYRPRSKKAVLCAAGREALYAYCERRGIPFRRCGKLVVATTSADVAGLADLELRGRANGIKGTRRLTAAAMREREPEVNGLAGLWVPVTGVVDFRSVARAFAEDLRAAGGALRSSARVMKIRFARDEVIVESAAGAFRCRALINCAGLESDRVARLAGVETDLRIIPFRGEYFEVSSKMADRIRGLIYPVPRADLPFLGVHFTRTVHDRVLVGPNAVPALSRRGYRRTDLSLRDTWEIVRFRGSWHLARRFWRAGAREVARSLTRDALVTEARRLIPDLEKGDLVPAESGVRAQAVSPAGALLDDFRFARLGQTLHVLNAPSPAATAALAIARVVADRLER